MRIASTAVFKCSVVIALTITTADGMATDHVAHPGGLVKTAGVSVIVYKPPQDIKAPVGRVGGGPRGTTVSTALVEVLAPTHVGRTSKAQPVIYWYLSDPVNSPIDVFVSSADDRDAFLDITLEPPIDAGVHRVALGEHGVHLAVGRRYKFNVFLRGTGDGLQSSAAIALIERVRARLDSTRADSARQPVELANTYAQDGLWYDAMQAVSDHVEQGTDTRRAREIRAQLLEQVGLPSVAEYDRRR